MSGTVPTDPHADSPATHAQARPGAAVDGWVAHARDLLKRLFRGFDGSLALRLWNGTSLKPGNGVHIEAEPRFTLVFRRPSVVRALVLGRDPLRFVEACFRGDIDIEGDFFAALTLKDHLHWIALSPLDRLLALFTALRLLTTRVTRLNPATDPSSLRGQSVRAHSNAENLNSIAFHYDVSNDFYALWLDRAMVYSCAYFEQPDGDLDGAQHAKLDHICRKLLLQPGERLLDIGCGWGALVIHAARHYGVTAPDITLSTEFINRYVFPDGQKDTISNIQRFRERAHFEIADVESLRPHYAPTLRHWRSRLEVTFVAAYLIHAATMVSVWCFFAAILSFIVYFYFRQLRAPWNRNSTLLPWIARP